MNLSKSDISNYNLIFIFISIIWQPLQTYFLHVDGQGLTVFILSVLAVLLNLGMQRNCRNVFRSPGFICWSILALYSLVNLLIKGYSGEQTWFVFLKANFFQPYIFLCIVIVELMHNKHRCLQVILSALLLFMLMGSTHIGESEIEEGRLVAEGIGNLLPLSSMVALYVAAVLFSAHRLKGRWCTFGAILLFALYLIVLTSTRKALGGSLIILVGLALTRIKKLDLKTLTKGVILVLLLVAGTSYIINHTFIEQRFESQEEMVEVPLSSNPRVNDFLMKFLGDRAIQYYEGSIVHQQQPLTGIGLCNYREVTDSQYRLHSEYLVQYCENGLVGFSLLMIFYFMLLIGLRRRRKNGRSVTIYTFGLVVILFVNFTAWTYCITSFMIVYALILMAVYSDQLWPGTPLHGVSVGYLENPLIYRKFKGGKPPRWVRNVLQRKKKERPSDLLAINKAPQPIEPVEETPHHSPYRKWVVVLLIAVVVVGLCYCLHGVFGDRNPKIGTAGYSRSWQEPVKLPKSDVDLPVWEKYDRMDIRLLDGDYYIVAFDRMVTARDNDNTKAIAARVFGGEEWSPYIEVFNGISDTAVLPRGHEVKIPKLVRKKILNQRLKKYSKKKRRRRNKTH